MVHGLLAKTDAGHPTDQDAGRHLDRQAGGIVGEAARGETIETHAAIEVSAVLGLRFQGLPLPDGDEAVTAKGGEEDHEGTGRGLHPTDDEPHRGGGGFSPKGSMGDLGHVGAAVHPVGGRLPSIFEYRLDEIAQAIVLMDRDGEEALSACGRRRQWCGYRLSFAVWGKVGVGSVVHTKQTGNQTPHSIGVEKW